MKLGRRNLEEPQINLTSLIDVVFLLLIFFMVTTTFVNSSGLEIILPEAGGETQAAPDNTLEVAVDAADRVYVRGEAVASDPQTLRAELQKLAGGDFDRPLRIRADGRAHHQAVVQLMDIAAKLGFERVDISTLPFPVEAVEER